MIASVGTNKTWRCVGVLTLVLMRTPLLFGQGGSAEPPQSVTIDDVLRLLEERSPLTVAERASVAVVAADLVTARTLPNPTISYGGVHLVSGLSTGATTQHQVGLEQPLLMFHQRQARLDAAGANVKAEGARVAERQAARRLAVRQAFASLLARQEQLRVVQQSVTDLQQVQRLVTARAAAGDRSQYDVLRVDVETGALRIQSLNAATDVDDVSGQLATLVGVPGWSPRAVGTLDMGTASTDVEQLWLTAQERRPSLVTLRQQQAVARGGVALARRERLPVPSLSGGTQQTQNVNGTSAFFGLSIPLLVFDHNQGAIARATAQLEVSDLQITAGLSEARAEVERAAAVLRQRRETLTVFDTTVGDRIPTLQRMAEDAYREGSADILELLDANRSLHDLKATRIQLLEAVKLAEEQLISAAGLDASGPHP